MVQTTFWSDEKVIDDFAPEDKFFYLYILTNPHTNLCGCYQISFKQMVLELGYTEEKIKKLINRFEKVHNLIRYSIETKEVLITNWYKYNWTSSAKFRKPLLEEINRIKKDAFKKFLLAVFENPTDESIPYAYGIDTSDSVVVTDTVPNKEGNKEAIKEIVDYLNLKTGKSFQTKSTETVKHINARLREGYSVEDFKTVIDKKTEQWLKNEKMEKHLNPSTLFGVKHFETYLNEKGGKRSEAGVRPMEKYSDEELDRIANELRGI